MELEGLCLRRRARGEGLEDPKGLGREDGGEESFHVVHAAFNYAFLARACGGNDHTRSKSVLVLSGCVCVLLLTNEFVDVNVFTLE